MRKEFKTADGSMKWFEGTVTERTEELKTGRHMWRVTYPDGDAEDLYHEQLVPILIMEAPIRADDLHECNHANCEAHAHDLTDWT